MLKYSNDNSLQLTYNFGSLRTKLEIERGEAEISPLLYPANFIYVYLHKESQSLPQRLVQSLGNWSCNKKKGQFRPFPRILIASFEGGN